MNSNTGNPKAGETELEAEEPVQESGTTIEVHVTDRRRFTPDGDPVADEPATDDENRSSVADHAVEELRMKLKEAEEKRIEAERQVKDFAERFRHAQTQLKTETEEQRARMQRTFEQKFEAARGEIIATLLDTLDNLKRAVSAAEKSEHNESDFSALLEGVRATAGLFESRMQGMGLKPILSIGQEFDPEVHEAVEIVPVSEDQDNRVIDEYQTGYRFGEKLLRPARVRVGRGEK